MLISSEQNVEINRLQEQDTEIQTSLNLIFTRIVDGKRQFLDIIRRDFIELYHAALEAVSKDLMMLADNPDSAARLYKTVDTEADSIEYINEICRYCGDMSFATTIENSISDAFNADGFLSRIRSSDNLNTGDSFVISHAERLCRNSRFLLAYVKLLRKINGEASGRLERLNPTLENIMREDQAWENVSNTVEFFTAKAEAADPFAGHRAYRYVNGEFYPANMNNIRPVNNFFGYLGVRQNYADHFEGFIREEHNVPLLISSLPGLGKTHLTISYALRHPKVTLILPEPEDLVNGLETLIGKLAPRTDRKFVIFFDDIEPDKINWYYFRTHIGGSIALPSHITVALASNYEFPANISSRGLGIKFPIFDELRCMEMIEEFLISMGMRHPRENLIMTIAADYVEQFGQHRYEELSPRTLIRYLDTYKHDRDKRRRVLEASSGDLVFKPDPQAFHSFNVNLMKAIYGPEIVDILREEQLKKDLGII